MREQIANLLVSGRMLSLVELRKNSLVFSQFAESVPIKTLKPIVKLVLIYANKLWSAQSQICGLFNLCLQIQLS